MTAQTLAGARIGLLTASASNRGGGVAEAVATQAALIRRLGGEAMIFALADGEPEATRARVAPSPLTLAPIAGPRQIGFAPSLVDSLLAANLDLLHLHGIWMYPSRAGLLWVRRTGRPYVISPHGMLCSWILAGGRAKKALARIGYERAGWAAARALHALTPEEAAEIARESGRKDALVIPNAGPTTKGVRTKMPPPQILYLGRIHRQKNLEALVTAWTRAQRPPDAKLTIVGWGEAAEVEALNRLIAATGDPSIAFPGPVYGAAKEALLEQARFLVLPSLAEGLPMVVLEAWAAGTPAIVSRQCNLGEGVAAGAALHCKTEPGALAETLSKALALDTSTWLAMARAAHDLAVDRFGADRICAQWGEAYSAMIEGRRAG